MKLITNTEALSARRDDFYALGLIAGAGFDAFDLTMTAASHPLRTDDYLSHARAVKRRADELSLPCLQAHAPFGLIDGAEAFAHYVSLHLRAIQMCHELECDMLVVHPGNHYTAARNYECLYAKLLPTAEHLGVRIATENMWSWDAEHRLTFPTACGTVEDFAACVDMAHSPFMTACVDVGHAEMTGAPGAAALIRGLGKDRIGCLHIHDNDLVHDLHTLPFQGKIDWDSVITALRDIGYEGNFTYEAHKFLAPYPDELLDAVLCYMERLGRYFIKRLRT